MGISLIAVPSAGAAPLATTTDTAIAAWQLNGPVSANVSLQATEVMGPTAASLFFFVSEQFCDTTHHQEVFRTFQGHEPVHSDVFVVGPHLGDAVLVAPTLQLTGDEQRLAGCVSPSGIPQTVSLGTSRAFLSAVWQATGPVTVIEPGTVGRPASARGFEFSTGPLNLGDLGAAQSAQLTQTTTF